MATLYDTKNIFGFGTGSAFIYGIRKREKKMFEVGNKVSVLLPHWVQIHDMVEPYVAATVVQVSKESVTVEYNAPDTWAGKATLVVHDLGRISKA